MLIKIITSDAELSQAASLSLSSHQRLRAELPFLPSRTKGDFLPRIQWVAANGSVLGAFDGVRMLGFLGFFMIEDYRNLEKAAYSPDWCMGWADEQDGNRILRLLYREACGDWLGRNIMIHAASAYSCSAEALDAFRFTGFGTIVQDAARPADELAVALENTLGGALALGIRRASAADAFELERLHRGLAAHIGAPPVSMPRTSGMSADEWRDWLSSAEAACLVAEAADGSLTGFIKAEAAQMDVSYAVHGEGTLAISGLWVEPALRGRGVARALLASLVTEALARGKPLVSVDFETMNLEAMAFWSRYFRPVSHSMERRF